MSRSTSMLNAHETDIFSDMRPQLMGLAYRILGSVSEAEDAIQDTFVKWAQSPRETIKNPQAWLTTACTRRCIDILRSSWRARVDYVGAWLPEPIISNHTKENSLENTELASSLTTAFLLMLERLTAKERAAFLLHEIFEISYAEMAETLNVNEAVCRKLVSRAKTHIDKDKIRCQVSAEAQNNFLMAFKSAVSTGNTDHLTNLLTQDITLRADAGGKVAAITKVLRGKKQVLAFISNGLQQFWKDLDWSSVEINSAGGFIIQQDQHIHATVSFDYQQNNKVAGIFIMRNPDKLKHLSRATNPSP